MVLTLVGNPGTTCTRRVATVLQEKGVPFEFKSVDLMKREQKEPEFLEKQPFGVVPYIVNSLSSAKCYTMHLIKFELPQDDDGFILYESRAICQYIASKYADQGTPGLVPDFTDRKAYALFQQASSAELAYFNEYAEKAVLEKVIKPYVISELEWVK